MRALLASALGKDGYKVTTCGNGINLLDHIAAGLHGGRGENYDLVVSDIRMPGLTALEVLEDLRGSSAAPPLILITAFGDEHTHAEADRLGVLAVFDKPFQIDRLLETAHRVAPPHRTRPEMKRHLEPGVTAARILDEIGRAHGSRRRRLAAQTYCGRWVSPPGWKAEVQQNEERSGPADRHTLLLEEGTGAEIVVMDRDLRELGASLVTVEGRIGAVEPDRITLDHVDIKMRGSRDPLGR
jgi:CheY-like chemotaxis protein